MLVEKTIKCKVFRPTKKKLNLLEEEYQKLQTFLQTGKDEGLYSVNKQQALRFYKRVKHGKEYPISVRKDLIDIQKTDNKLSEYWLKVRVGSVWGGINLAIKPHCEIPDDVEYCESKLLKKGKDFYFHLVIKKEVKIKESYSGILAVDIGQKCLAVSVASHRRQPKFHGKEIRAVRRHYSWLRRRLGEKKLLKKIKEMGQKEKRIVNQIVHEVTKELVDEADEHDLLIVFGNLTGLRENQGDTGKMGNRIISNFVHHRFAKYLEYKAKEKGIRVLKMNEHYTTKTCSRCGYRRKSRPKKQFYCPRCGYRINSDFNGAKNEFKRTKVALDKIPTVGAVSGPALNSSEMVSTSARSKWEDREGKLQEERLTDAPGFSLG